MKKILILVLGTLMCTCTTDTYTETTISVLEDVTEIDFVLTPNDSVILPLLDVKNNLWQGLTFRYGTLSDKEHNKRQEVTLESETELLGNSFKRKQKVTKYQKKIIRLLQKPKDKTTYRYSTIWEPLVKELQILQNNPNSKNTLYLFSDLQENADWFSVHRTADFRLLQRDKQAVTKLFLEKAKKVNCTHALSIIVVYQPRTRAEDKTFKIMKGLYTSVFSELGIPIAFVANLNTD